MNHAEKPIGYWLRRADELLTTRIDEAQRASGLDRLDWQLLNVVHEGGATRNRITEVMHAFANAHAINSVLNEFARRGLIGGTDTAGYELTPAGEELYQRALALQTRIREEAVAGISPDEFATAMSVLRRLVENLERAGRAG